MRWLWLYATYHLFPEPTGSIEYIYIYIAISRNLTVYTEEWLQDLSQSFSFEKVKQHLYRNVASVNHSSASWLSGWAGSYQSWFGEMWSEVFWTPTTNRFWTPTWVNAWYTPCESWNFTLFFLSEWKSGLNSWRQVSRICRGIPPEDLCSNYLKVRCLGFRLRSELWWFSDSVCRCRDYVKKQSSASSMLDDQSPRKRTLNSFQFYLRIFQMYHNTVLACVFLGGNREIRLKVAMQIYTADPI